LSLKAKCGFRTAGENRNYCFGVARNAREPFKAWIPAFAGMTGGSFGGLRQKSPNPPYMYYLEPGFRRGDGYFLIDSTF
jgi:hypothetical protein